MLIKCPECDLQVSDKAYSCPHCGYPLKESTSGWKPVKSKKRMRLPNGFGQITCLQNSNLRNPWRVMVSVGKTPEGKPIQRLLKPKSYFKTYNEAYEALIKYHQNPFNLSEDTTMGMLFDLWSNDHFEGLSESAQNGYRQSWAYCHSIADIKVINITKKTLSDMFETCYVLRKNKKVYPSATVKRSMKQLLVKMFEWAIARDMVPSNPAKYITLSKAESLEANTVQNPHTKFSDEEMQIIWEHSDLPIAKMLLINCYTGWRPGELCEFKKDAVNFDEMSMTGGKKTKAGYHRTVPIHSKVAAFVRYFYDTSPGDYLFPDDLYNYNKYNYSFRKFYNEYFENKEHRLHDCRVQFVSMAKKAHMDEYVIKIIAGHTIRDITEAVYTKRDIEWLREEIEKIK